MECLAAPSARRSDMPCAMSASLGGGVRWHLSTSLHEPRAPFKLPLGDKNENHWDS
eukprot:CAMPEP_0170626372 /NCGR_PEP_ID=MMETSP0224-20130122/31322_1 /TAXON_ID=285029 /ORGANISM="Togula jolla, Strain CCCM 725" /LENGTH=55 /DNA_ID=CAMNT_0010953139 /DNA_START=157 /DNA_END=321 /DNA_ORIENTATION=-